MNLPSIEELIVAVTPLAWPDIYAVRKAESELTKRSGGDYPSAVTTIDLVEYVLAWRRFVLSVSTGYRLHREDYQNSLAGRDTLEQIVELLPGDFAARIRGVLPNIDAVFRENTNLIERTLWRHDSSASEDLFRRIPAAARRDVLEDLMAETYRASEPG